MVNYLMVLIFLWALLCINDRKENVEILNNSPFWEKKHRAFFICFCQLTVNEKLFLSLLASLRSKRFWAKNEERELKTARKMSQLKERGGGGEERFLPSPSSSPLFHFLALVWFLARSKAKISYLGLSLLRNQTETLATQASFLQVLSTAAATIEVSVVYLQCSLPC